MAMRVTSLLVSVGSALAVTPLVVHLLGDKQYGLWALATVLSGYYALFDLGLSGAVIRHLAGALGRNDREESNRVASTALVMYFGVGFAVLLASILIAAVASYFLHDSVELATYQKVVIIMGLGIGSSVPMRVFIAVLNANLRFDVSAGLEILSTVVRTLLTVGFLLMGFRILSLAWINCGTAVLTLLSSLIASRRVCPQIGYNLKNFRYAAARKLLTYGSISLVAQIADVLRYQMDGFIVAGFVGLEAVTHYNIGGSMATYYIGLMLAGSGTLAPVFSRLEGGAQGADTKKLLYLSTRAMIAFATFVAFGLIALGRPFIAGWMGISYLDAYPVLVTLVLGSLAGMWQSPSLQLLFGVSKHAYFAVFNSAEGVANLALSLLLVRHFGIIGVALGTAVPMVITKLFIQPWYVCKVANLNVWEYWAVMAKAILFTMLSLIVPALLATRLAAPDYRILAALAVGSLCCFAPMVYFLLFSSEERATIRSMLHRSGAA